MSNKTKINISAPHRQLIRDSFDQSRKSKGFNASLTSRVQSKQHILRFDINTLLSLFNQMDVSGSNEVSKKGIKRILDTIGLYSQQHNFKAQNYTFDQFLSILGDIEVPNEPSIYVLSFVRILANYRDKCLLNEEEGLQQAQQVQQKIKMISQKQIQRQKNRIRQQHSKIYDQMQVSQQQQFRSFEEQWKTYLREFRDETSRRLQETKYQKKSKIIQEEVKFINKSRKNNIITSPRLRQLIQKKKWLIHDQKFEDAINISNKINQQKLKISQFKEEQTDNILTKKLQKLANHTNRYIGVVQKNLEVNLNRLVSKKRQGQSIMKIRMKNLREQANKKLNQHFRTQINRLRSSFYLAANP